MQETYQDEVYSEKLVAGKRAYYFDVKETRDGARYVVISELSGGQRHKIFVYEEYFDEFLAGLENMKPHMRKS